MAMCYRKAFAAFFFLTFSWAELAVASPLIRFVHPVIATAAFPFKENLEPGTFSCYYGEDALASSFLGKDPCSYTGDPGARPQNVRGYCVYQARQDQVRAVFNNLLNFARSVSESWNQSTGLNEYNLAPQKLGDSAIMWWFDDNNASNCAMGKFLQERDHPDRVYPTTMVTLTIQTYMFESGHDSEFGFAVAGFYGLDKIDETPTPLVSYNPANILSAGGILGNPLGSFLSFGFNATSNQKWMRSLRKVVMPCTVGVGCTYRNTGEFFFTHPLGIEESDVGIEIYTNPRVDPIDPSLVYLESFSFEFSRPTGDENQPVENYNPFGHRSFPMRTDQLYILAVETSEMDMKMGELLGTGEQFGHDRLISMVQAEVILPDADAPPIPTFQFQTPDRSFDAEELASLPDGDLSFQDVLESLDLVCFDDLMNPESSQQFCGFRFTKMDQKYIDYPIRIEIDGTGDFLFFGGGSELRFGESDETVKRMGTLYKGKGYYQLPLLEEEPANFEVTIEIDDSSTIGEARRKREKIKGVRFEFGYLPDDPSPIDFQALVRDKNGNRTSLTQFHWIK